MADPNPGRSRGGDAEIFEPAREMRSQVVEEGLDVEGGTVAKLVLENSHASSSGLSSGA